MECDCMYILIVYQNVCLCTTIGMLVMPSLLWYLTWPLYRSGLPRWSLPVSLYRV